MIRHESHLGSGEDPPISLFMAGKSRAPGRVRVPSKSKRTPLILFPVSPPGGIMRHAPDPWPLFQDGISFRFFCKAPI